MKSVSLRETTFKSKKWLLLILAIFCFFTLFGCDDKTKNPTISLLDNSVDLFVGEKYEVKPIVTNIVGDDIFDYSVDKENIIEINGNTITAINDGSVTITVSLKDFPNVRAILTVNVSKKVVPEIKIIGENAIKVGESITLKAETKNTTGSVSWSSSDESIATVSDGVVTGVKAGEVVITAKCDGVSSTIKILVTKLPIIVVSGPNTIVVGETSKLVASLEGYTGDFDWESSDPSIVTVKGGIITGVSAGEAIITVSGADKTVTVTIVVLKKPTITLSGKNVVYIGKTMTITAKTENVNGKITWKSSKENIATVDENGVVTGVSEGETFISASYGNATEKMKISVMVEPKQVVLDYDGGVSIELYKGVKPVSELTLNNLNGNSGHYWNDSGYANYIFISNRDNDPTATFSDRIYIGKNSVTGYYEIVNILTSGGSSWPDGAEYVITISSSYSGYRSAHSQVLKLKAGQIVSIENSVSSISASKPSPVKFYDKEIDIDTITFDSKSFRGLPTPTKLGYKFLGWYNENGEKIDHIGEINGSIELKARWEELNPVTDIITDNMPEEMVTGETIQLNSKVSPANAHFKDVFFETSNSDIISIDKNGKMVAINAGKATITITDYVGKVKKEYEITVYPISSVDVVYEDYSKGADYNGVLKIDETIRIKGLYYGKGQLSEITYTSSNPSVVTIDENGMMKAISNGVSIITIKIVVDGKEYSLLVNTLVENIVSESKLEEVLKMIIENNFGIVETGNICLYDDGTDRYYAATYGSVNRILFDSLKIDHSNESIAENNPNCHRSRRPTDTIQFVTVHDTATLTGTALNIATNMASNETSIHYVVGNNNVYGVVPEKYIAYHAGDGTGTTFEWYASGIKATTNSTPKIGIVKDGAKYYFTINGEKTKLVAPTSNGTKSIVNPSNDSLTELGPVWKIENGEYYIGKTWVCLSQVAAGKICSYGGNNNSIGIEMCVNMIGDMYDTWQRTAMLVADICIRNKLDLTRVKQHNTWTGKNCPQDIIAGKYWDNFMKMVEVQYVLQKDYSDIKITMKSNNPEIVNDFGRVTNAPSITTTVSYTVTVSDGTNSKTITLYSVVPGTTTWEQWNGTYSAKKIWNDGRYTR